MNLELIWMNTLGTEHNLGTVGEFSGKYDANREPIMVGDMVDFEYDGETRSSRIVKHWLTCNPQLLGFESLSDEIFDKQELKLAPRNSLSDGVTVWVGYGDMPDRIVVRKQVEKNYHHDPVKGDNPFTLVTLAMLMLDNVERFEPAKPTYDLLLTLFGGTEDIPCKYNPDNITPHQYGQYIKVWSPRPGHYLYLFVGGVAPEPLAYIRIYEDLCHGPNSHLRRIEKAYYFCQHLNWRVGDFINKIYRPDPDVPRGEVLTDAATQLAITLILDAPKDEILN
mgnify:CR=1 FL=1